MSLTDKTESETKPKSGRWSLVSSIGYGVMIGVIICGIIFYSLMGRNDGSGIIIIFFPGIVAATTAGLPILAGLYNTVFHWNDSIWVDWLCGVGVTAALLMNIPSPFNKCPPYNKFNGKYVSDSGDVVTVNFGYGCIGRITTPSGSTEVAKFISSNIDVVNGKINFGGPDSTGTKTIEVGIDRDGMLWKSGLRYTKQ